MKVVYHSNTQFKISRKIIKMLLFLTFSTFRRKLYVYTVFHRHLLCENVSNHNCLTHVHLASVDDGIVCKLQNNLIRNNCHSLNRDLDFICIKLFWILTPRQWHPHPTRGQVLQSSPTPDLISEEEEEEEEEQVTHYGPRSGLPYYNIISSIARPLCATP